MIEELKIESPKRASHPQSAWDVFFPYYAGFPENFARTLLLSAKLAPSAVVFDPWNGSGTTTYAASNLGFSAIGFDLNPVMVIVARARMLPVTEADSIEPLAREVVRDARASRTIEKDDPLHDWFGSNTVAQIRGLERSIRRHLVGKMTAGGNGLQLENISGLAATFYVALFSACRALSTRYQSSNPTWLRRPKAGEQKVGVSRASLAERFTDNLLSMAAALAASSERAIPGSTAGSFDIRIADTTSMVIEQASVDFVLTSPPYCTRIDYTAATRIELAILGPLLSADARDLSRRMLGSIRVPSCEIIQKDEWGETCNSFLDTLRQHKSKASAGYYFKTHVDYFDKMSRSLSRMHEALKPGGSAVLVVQDSHYKDIHNDLPTIIQEMGKHIGLDSVRRKDFRLNRSMSGINPYSRLYDRSVGATEAVLCLHKA